MEIAFLTGRIIFGGYFFLMGINHFAKSKMLSGYAASKGIPSPSLAVYGSGLLIILGGLGVLLGVYPQVSLFLIIIFLIPVTFFMHAFWNDTDPQMRMVDQVNFLKNIALLGAALALYGVGTPWLLSI